MRRANTLIGQSIERVEDYRFLRGEGTYVGDLAMPGMLHGVILRSSVAHGTIDRIDTSMALAIPGVHAVITAATIGDVPTIPIRQEPLPEMLAFVQPVIATGKVRYVGEPIALVLADSAAIAEDALEAIVLEITVLPSVADWRASATDETLLFEANGTNWMVSLTAILGDADAAFANAPYRRSACFQIGRHSAVPMEPRGLAAAWDAAAEHMTLWGAAKVAFPNRRLLASMMGLAEDAVTLVENDVGGGFGVRGEFYPEDFLIPFAARHVGRPVKWIEDRREHLLATNHARDVTCELEIACDRQGNILALRGEAHADIGAYIRTAGSTGGRNVAQVMSGPYRIANIQMGVTLHATNKTPVGTYRGPGRFEADFCRERLLDMIAGDLGLDRVEFRRRNLLVAADHPWTLATVQPLNLGTRTDSGEYRETLDRALSEIGWVEKQALSGRCIEGRYHGTAVGCYLEGGASGPREHASLVLEDDGTISVHVGSSSVGQGVETVFTQIAADALELPMTAIRGIRHGSTGHLVDGFGSYSSRSVVMGGSAVLDAADKLRGLMRAAAAVRLGCAGEALIFGDDRLNHEDGRSVSFAALAPLRADGVFASSTRTYSYGAHAAHVSVDPGTGAVQVHEYVAVEDVGRAINPMTLHGQTVGAVVQGLGGALLEQFVYDSDCQLLTGSLADYLMPTASDFPHVHATVLENHPSPNNPLGAKGAGEGGIIPVGGIIANAIADALAVFAAEPNRLPLTPPYVWHLCQQPQRPLQTVTD
jgi:carbon-monoxide dehydrogenase large subunit